MRSCIAVFAMSWSINQACPSDGAQHCQIHFAAARLLSVAGASDMIDARSCCHKCSWPDLETHTKGAGLDMTTHVGCFPAAGML